MKNYRKFDQDSSKSGERYFLHNRTCVWLGNATGGNDDRPNIVEILSADERSSRLEYARSEDLFQIPMQLIEGIPVYSDSILYVNGVACNILDEYVSPNAVKIQYVSNSLKSFVDIRMLTWTKPKVKKSGWINIYPDLLTCGTRIYSSESNAEMASIPGSTQIEIHWEE